jgi:hypothetical protein
MIRSESATWAAPVTSRLAMLLACCVLPPVWAAGTAAPPGPAQERINDTGVTFCAGVPTGNDLPCDQAAAAQDARHGRDALAAAGRLEKVGAGSAGFDFSKVSAAGEVLAADAAEWACVRDNHTGLLWELKSPDPASPRFAGHEYTWFQPDSLDGNPGVAGNTRTCRNSLGGKRCNAHEYVQMVNAIALCGASDWRLPSVLELQGIVDYGRIGPAIDPAYFPHTQARAYLSSTPYADNRNHIWMVSFGEGFVGFQYRFFPGRVRLVSAAP